MTTTTTHRPASDKQTAFITRLLGEKNTTGTRFEGHTTAPEGLTTRTASQAIDDLLRLPRHEGTEENRPANAVPGYYATADGDFIVVVQNRAGTGTYAKTLVFKTTEDGKQRGTWTYAPGLGRRLAGSRPMTLDEAAAFGHLHGFCIVCGKSLTDPKSVQAGIGPVCAKRFNR